jgi:hypothetical protein
MENVGKAIPQWWELGKFAIVFLIALLAFIFGYRYYKTTKASSPEETLGKGYLFLSLLMVVLLIVAIVFFYFSFGPGEKIPLSPGSEEGINRMVDEYPAEKDLSTIKKEAQEKRPDVLKRQDQGFEKDAKEADDFLKKALEDAEKSKKKKKKED